MRVKKFKKLFFLIGVFIIIFAIYLANVDSRVNYVALGDSIAAGQNPYGERTGYGYTDYVENYLSRNDLLKSYIKGFAVSGYKTTDLLTDIEINKHIEEKGKEYNIRKALRESDIVTVSIGANDFLANIDLKNISNQTFSTDTLISFVDKMVPNLKSVFKEIRKFAKKEVIVVSYFNPMPKLLESHEKEVEAVLDYANTIYRDLCKEYKMTYISVVDEFKLHPEYLPNPFDIHPNTKGYLAMATPIIQYLDESVFN